MATTVAEELRPPALTTFAQTTAGRNFFLMLGVAAIVGVMATVWLWGRQPDYRVLFSSFTDRDGGAIVASLQQMNIPYKYAEGGGAILVPAEQVHDARLKLAAQGLPKGGNVGFELMENQKLGVSQFLEQVNFQRALEGELARSIESVGGVQGARVHLALPKATVFVREQQKPTASILINLQAGRTLDRQQVSAIVHLVASSVPDLPAKNITLVDQNGNLLSELANGARDNTLDPSQLKYVQDMQNSIARRIEAIITPIVGQGNVRAEATADIDFSRVEQAAETYRPNQGNNNLPAIRSEQKNESTTGGANGPATGVPGALSNQAPAPSTAPLNPPVAAGGAAGTAAAAAAAAANASSQRESTVNYELDKTVRYTQQPMGGIRRISVAVVVNNRQVVAANGAVSSRALTDAEKTQISDLVREAMGFNKERGDTLNVVNSPFAAEPKEVIPVLPIWQNPVYLNMAREIGKYLLVGIVLLFLFFKYLRPLLRRIGEEIAPPKPLRLESEDEADEAAAAAVQVDQIQDDPAAQRLENLAAAKKLARQDPKLVANVVKKWVDGDE
ncbi:MAG: flagellar basal-body MS-ring/collar protein FliF [Janthinobacterium lividum]